MASGNESVDTGGARRSHVFRKSNSQGEEKESLIQGEMVANNNQNSTAAGMDKGV